MPLEYMIRGRGCRPHWRAACGVGLPRQVCHARGLAVEAEIGRLSGTEDGLTVAEVEAKMTDPTQAAQFVAATGVDLLAVCIGNVHGRCVGSDMTRPLPSHHEIASDGTQEDSMWATLSIITPQQPSCGPGHCPRLHRPASPAGLPCDQGLFHCPVWRRNAPLAPIPLLGTHLVSTPRHTQPSLDRPAVGRSAR